MSFYFLSQRCSPDLYDVVPDHVITPFLHCTVPCPEAWRFVLDAVCVWIVILILLLKFLREFEEPE